MRAFAVQAARAELSLAGTEVRAARERHVEDGAKGWER